MSLSELMMFKHLVSSAYINGVEWTVDRGRSLMKIPNNNMFLVFLPGHFCQAVKHFLLTIQIILWIALHKK